MWEDVDRERPLPLWSTLWQDIAAEIGTGDQAPKTLRERVTRAARYCLASSGFRCRLNYRLGHSARAHLGTPGRVIAGALFWWNRHFYGCAIASTARLHAGVAFPHPFGISIGPGVVVGPNTWIFQNVILVGSPTKKHGMPVIGRNSALFAGAVVSGPVRVGDQVWIGANAVVAKDLEDGTFYCAPEGREISLALLGLLPQRDASEPAGVGG